MNDPIVNLCKAIQASVVETGVVTSHNVDVAIRVMRAEVKSFLTSDDHASEREVLLTNRDNGRAIFTSIVASCALKIREAS